MKFRTARKVLYGQRPWAAHRDVTRERARRVWLRFWRRWRLAHPGPCLILNSGRARLLTQAEFDKWQGWQKDSYVTAEKEPGAATATPSAGSPR
jgi:hypothetical protein